MPLSTALATAAAARGAAMAVNGSGSMALLPGDEAIESLLLAELISRDEDPEVNQSFAEMFLGRRVSLPNTSKVYIA